jgi:lysophospholipase L1-like esterase
MEPNSVFIAMQERFKTSTKTRILAFGSSNTQRFLPGMHWFDVFELAIDNTFLQTHQGKTHFCINAGICGNSTTDLLKRFDEDAALYQPHLVFITIGGNDSIHKMPEAEFESNLRELHRRFNAKGCAVVFQTYYSPDPSRTDDLALFYRFMDIIRKVAKSTGAGLVDHLRRWELFRKAYPELYLKMMHDCFHVKCYGNMLMGLDIGRHFGATVSRDTDPAGFWDESLRIQKLIDNLEK